MGRLAAIVLHLAHSKSVSSCAVEIDEQIQEGHACQTDRYAVKLSFMRFFR
jgi:hypothetical protein